ncbi:hypothetical protein BV911_16965 [Pseudoruegeria sp. SK021]|nr:hypothetical protein BV911_16965 [Pseudoruegeria sp. SK021]
MIEALKIRHVRYCHWKSNIRLDDGLNAEDDLDLLVYRPHAEQFFAALTQVGFKLAEARFGSGHPGVLHAFAVDPDSLKLVHVHAYFQIVSGDSLVKSYHLPLESLLLDGAAKKSGMPIPSAEAEMVVFCLRILLKHSSLLETLLVNRHYGSVAEEFAWLHERASATSTRALWLDLIPNASGAEFDELCTAIADPAALVQRVRLGLRLSWRLRGWRRLGHTAAVASRLWRLVLLISCRLRRRRPRRLVAGGAMIAFVGPKASGKSTLGAALSSHLGTQLDLHRIHVGKPPATLLSAPFRLFLPLLRRALPGERSGEYQTLDRRNKMRYSFVYIVRMLLLAHDRRVQLLRSHRAATKGTIVVADRYPSLEVGAIDSSPFSDAAIAASGSRLKSVLMRRERRFYENLPQPDLVIRLVAPIETTLARDASRNKRDGPDPQSLRRRRDIETVAEFPGVPVSLVSSNRSLDDTIADVVRGVWFHL